MELVERKKAKKKKDSQNILPVLSVKLKVTTAIPLFSECSCKNSFQ